MALFGTNPLDELLIPDGTHVEEHDLVADGDVIIASQSAVEFGVRGGNVIAGERVRFGGHIEADGDCRLDTWCDIDGNVLVSEDAYLGERVHIAGELRVAGNLDIGDDVQIDKGFEANGWIVIRNPMPTIVFLFIYLSQLLRIGEEDAAEQLLAAMTDADNQEHQPVLIPRGSRVGDDAWQVSTPGRIGDDCRLHGNIRAKSLVVGRDNEIFGSLRAREGITVGARTEVTGNVTTREGTVRVGPGTTIRGDVAGQFVEVHREATVEGAIRATEEMSMVSDPVLDDAVVDSAVESEADESAEESAESEQIDSDEANATEDELDDADEGELDDAETDEGTVSVADEADTGEPEADGLDADGSEMEKTGKSDADETDESETDTMDGSETDGPEELESGSSETDDEDETEDDVEDVMDVIQHVEVSDDRGD